MAESGMTSQAVLWQADKVRAFASVDSDPNRPLGAEDVIPKTAVRKCEPKAEAVITPTCAADGQYSYLAAL